MALSALDAGVYPGPVRLAERAPTTPPIRIMLVDDHRAFRQPLAYMFDREPDLSIVAEVGSIAEAREILPTVKELLDIAIVDLQLPDGDGIEFIRELRRACSQCRALVLTGDGDKLHLAQAIEAGASGVMIKTAQPSDIANAIRKFSAGQAIQSADEVMEFLLLAAQSRDRERVAQTTLASLTGRERQVLAALARGLDNRAIGSELFISHETARTHVVNLLAKLHVDSRLQAAIFAIRHGIA